MMLKCGIVKHAIVVGVELPIIEPVVQSYIDTGVLSQNSTNDPYAEDTSGFHPGESASAIVLENSEEKIGPELLGYWCNSDADSPIGMPEDGGGLAACMQKAIGEMDKPVSAICPHASGTWLHAQAEQTALHQSLNTQEKVSLHLIKPYTGHTVGASGILDTAILAHYARINKLPPNLPGLTKPAVPFSLPEQAQEIQQDSAILKISVGMGGHNSIIALAP